MFQLAHSSVSSSELQDVSKARLVWQSDIKDGVGKLVNHIFDEAIGFDVPQIMVDGADEGISHTFSITKDLFAIGDDRLINEKEYYYMAVAYGYNNYLTYVTGNDGQKSSYKAGRRNLRQYTAIPHDPSVEGNGTKIQSLYGLSPEVKRVSGNGNGGRFVNLTKESIETILTSPDHKINQPVYSSFGSPIGVKVIDPVNVPDGDFRLEFLDSVTPGNLNDAYWRLLYQPKGESSYTDTVYAIKTLVDKYEQVIKEWGLSVEIEQVLDFGTSGAESFGLIGDSLQYKDPSKPWLQGIADEEGATYKNWIRSGNSSVALPSEIDFDDYYIGSAFEDTKGVFERIVNGWVAPFRYVSNERYGVATTPTVIQTGGDFSQMNNVDLVITSDQSKWSICPVFEMADEAALSQYGDDKINIKRGVSKDWNGNTLPEGLGYFPGYAIDVLTGERLNIGFGEYSFLAGDNGTDMLWNPTSSELDEMDSPLFGGFHSVFVFKKGDLVDSYDEGQSIINVFNSGFFGVERIVFNQCTWVYGYPIQNDAFPFLATDVTIKLRVNEPYESLGDLPVYEFNTAEIHALANQNDVAKENLDKVKVVPNPYYGFSEYEKNKLSNEVKITNLPKECTVKIFTLDGSLVKTIKKDSESQTSISWNVKNEQGIAVASGLYIFHIEAPGIGEKIIKWFGVQREIDLDSF